MSSKVCIRSLIGKEEESFSMNPKNVPGRYATSADCARCELCYACLPEVFQIDEDGKSYLKRQPKTQKELDLIQEAIENCPISGIVEIPD